MHCRQRRPSERSCRLPAGSDRQQQRLRTRLRRRPATGLAVQPPASRRRLGLQHFRCGRHQCAPLCTGSSLLQARCFADFSRRQCKRVGRKLQTGTLDRQIRSAAGAERQVGTVTLVLVTTIGLPRRSQNRSAAGAAGQVETVLLTLVTAVGLPAPRSSWNEFVEPSRAHCVSLR